jgi:Zn-dependent oligopeptidase
MDFIPVLWLSGGRKINMEHYLHTSIKQYRVIIDHARHLDVLLQDADPAALQAYTERLQQLQDQAGANDERVFELYAADSEYWKQHPLFIERNELLEQIVELNHLLLPKIRGIMAVIASELAHIKSGRSAVAGYHRPVTNLPVAARGVG